MNRLSILTFAVLVGVTLSFIPSAKPFGARRATSLWLETGVCKWFNTEKGYGFIIPDDGSSDVFVHQTAIQKEGFRSLADGEPVQYELEVDARTGKTKAVSVTGPGGAEVKGAPYPSYEDGDEDGWYEN